MTKNGADLEDKIPLDQLRSVLADAKEAFPDGSEWQHYRGDRYMIVGRTVDKNTNQLRIIYVRTDDLDVPFDCLQHEWEEPVSTKPGPDLCVSDCPADSYYEGPRFVPVSSLVEEQRLTRYGA